MPSAEDVKRDAPQTSDDAFVRLSLSTPSCLMVFVAAEVAATGSPLRADRHSGKAKHQDRPRRFCPP